ncbi:MAG: hypothetical protein RR687_00600 [Comamonas sp.]
MKSGLFQGGLEAPPFRQGNFSFAHEWLEQVGTLDGLLARLDALRGADDAHRYLCTLDDISQCSYTCGHAGQDERLYLDAPEDEDWDDAAQTQARALATLQHRVRQLAQPGLVQSWGQVCGSLAVACDDVDALLAANREPDRLLDEVIYVQRVPAALLPGGDVLIAAAPNGYFSADWDTFQNHAIICHLAAHYGYRFFAMGAAWMGFERGTPPDAVLAERLVQDLRELYGKGRSEVLGHAAWARLAQQLQARRTLVLGYAENLTESLGLDQDAE